MGLAAASHFIVNVAVSELLDNTREEHYANR